MATGFFVSVWDAVAGRVEDKCYGNNEFGYSSSRANVAPNVTIDATPDVVAAANAWLRARAEATVRSEREADINLAVARAKAVQIGREVEVVRGRKVPKGVVGDVFWMGDSEWAVRVGIRTADGTVYWTAASNVEVTQPDEFLELPESLTDAQFNARVDYEVKQRGGYFSVQQEAVAA